MHIHTRYRWFYQAFDNAYGDTRVSDTITGNRKITEMFDILKEQMLNITKRNIYLQRRVRYE